MPPLSNVRIFFLIPFALPLLLLTHPPPSHVFLPTQEEASEQSVKTSFFDDGQSMESKREREKEEAEEDPPGVSSEEMKNQPKVHDVTISSEDEAVMCVDLRRKRRMNPHDEYYSVKLPKFIGVCPDIGALPRRARGEAVYSNEALHAGEAAHSSAAKAAAHVVDLTHSADQRNVNDLEGEGRHPQLAKNQKAVISWHFDVDAYNRQKQKRETHAMKEEGTKREKQQCDRGEDPHKGYEAVEVHSEGSDLSHLTDDNLSDFSSVDELYQTYQVTHKCDDLMSLPCDDPNEKKTALCRNMEFLETNAFIVQYEDGKLIFFINERPYLLECDRETNYLIELSEMSVMPIHCILEKKFFLKAITREEQGGGPQGAAPPGMVDVYYSLHG
ncbi:hypothetical protein, conserved [Plasmodium vivax]|uniref:Uncharacterized protein n=3 Tax=Plasmodium vivax TaxID=5855 RepID=A5K7V9_PLAVS|nr:hypothetical protein, conserved [Plasmodium vivax]EDL44373.1 hypothetical protein, conserved [Plasmodium vivax]KMZ85494.1 hypothetical protein PVBG_02180 [Plasmodium vivax Brazil I]SCO68613.1 conserved Plasmodium protein, unknown function [Plasmodium vivax]|eukprot:XP_001614100.1 hypothetical protein [Plasmodium vivax Sal-1]